jgi:glycosyltransferase involved in cell wall biosynthesis
MPLFSVVIPSYNRADYIGRSIDSVLKQPFADREIIVAEDGSTDRTMEVLAGYGSQIRIVQQPNKGEGGARNLGVRAATGDYVVFLDSDDLHFPWTLQCLAEVIERHNRPALIQSRVRPFRDDAELASIRPQSISARYFPDYLAVRPLSVYGVNGTAIRRDLMLSVGDFMEDRIVGLDIDYMLRMGTCPGFVRIDDPPVFAYREHAGSISRDFRLVYRGLRLLVAKEKLAYFPGGPARAADRRRLLCLHVRSTAIRCAHVGQLAEAMDLYCSTFWWNLRLGRAKFLLALPPTAAIGALRRCFGNSRGG